MPILRRLLVPPPLLLLAVLAQVTVVNRLPLPGGGSPDLVLLVVVSLAVTSGPVAGMLAGFAGGLALDVAPPVSDLAGETALVYCVAGYACGVLAVQLSSREESGVHAWGVPDGKPSAPGMRGPGLPVLSSLPVMVAGVAVAEALRTGLGLMLSDPRMTGLAIEHVAPAAIVYDVLLCPLALWLVAAAMGAAPEPQSAVLSEPARPAPGHAVVRAAGAGPAVGGRRTAVPRLTFADSRQPPLRAPVPSASRLRFAASSASSFSRANRIASPRRHPLPTAHPARVHFDSASRDGVIGGSALRGTALRGGIRGGGIRGGGSHDSRLRGSALRGSSLRGGSLGGSFGGSGGGFSGALGPSLFAGAGSRGPGRNWLRASKRRPLAGSAGAASGGSGVRLLTGRPDGAARSPGKGWLQGKQASLGHHPASPGNGWIRARRTVARGRYPQSSSGGLSPASSPGKGWLRPAKPVAPARRSTPGRGWLKRKPARVQWQGKEPGRGWLGRGRLGRGTGLGGSGLRDSGLRGSGSRGSGMGAKTFGPGRIRIGGRR